MINQKFGDYSAFLEQKEDLIEILEAGMHKALSELGDDIKGVSWFSIAADEYTAETYDVAV